MLVMRLSVARSTRSRGGGTRPTIATAGKGRSFPHSPRPPDHRASCPARRTRRSHTSPDSPTTRPDRPLRSLAPSESPFTRPSPAEPELAPRPVERRRADALLGFALLEPSPPCPRVRSIARMPGEPDTPGRPRPAPVVERSASILRPRPSGPDGCARLAGRSTPTADVAHVRAPSRRRPCLSCPYAAGRDGSRRRGAGLQRSEGYGGGSISVRPTSSSRVSRLLDVRAR